MGLNVFVASSAEDKLHLDAFVARGRLEKLPFQFVEMPTFEEAEERWRSNCRIQIRGSGGVLGLVSKHSEQNPWQLWAIQCAVTENKPLLLMHTHQEGAELPDSIAGKRVATFSWTNARTWLESLWQEASRSR